MKYLTSHSFFKLNFSDNTFVGSISIPENADPTMQYSNLEPGAKFASLLMEKAYHKYMSQLTSDLNSLGMTPFISVTDFEISPTHYVITISFIDEEDLEASKAQLKGYAKFAAIAGILLTLLSLI
jgi:hypothetical protein